MLPSRLNNVFPILANNRNQPLILRGFKSALKIKWVRPEKIPKYKAIVSGDLEAFPQLDLKQPVLEFRESEELKTADELVKKLFSLEFASRRKQAETYLHETLENVRRHRFDAGSPEVKIAKMTGRIRAYQDLMEKGSRNVRMKVRLQELIDRRGAHLRYLRKWDYKRFEWLLDKLQIIYKPPPTESFPITRKDSLRKLTDKYCEETRNQRLNEYKLKLEAEQPAFLEEKIRLLEFIREEQRQCEAEVTVTQEEIDNVKEQLKELTEKNQESNNK